MVDVAADHSDLACDAIDEMIRSAALELFRTEVPALSPAQVLRGSLPAAQQRFTVGARVRFFGSGGAGFLALGCAEDFQVGATGSQEANAGWAVERAFALALRVEKRLRQFGITLRLEAPEACSALEGELSETPSLITTHLFEGGNGRLFVHLAGQLDLERIASAGDVPLRDEGDIILF